MLINEFEKLSLRKFQMKSILPDATILCLGKRRSGKCLEKGTLVLMADRTVQKVEDIKEGDLVMGDDFTPRQVLSVTHGYGTLYEIKHGKESYVVNSHHILSLIWTGNDQIFIDNSSGAFIVQFFDPNSLSIQWKRFSSDQEAQLQEWCESRREILVDVPIMRYLFLPTSIQALLCGYTRASTTPHFSSVYSPSPIKVRLKGDGQYAGFALDGNHRFMLANGIVTHNSWLVRDIFYHHRNIPSGVVFSGTEEASPFFSDFIPDCFIHSEYDPELIETIMNRQKRKIREAKLNGLSETGKMTSNNLFIVLDDMLHDAQNWKKDKTIKSIFFNGRHFNFLFVLTMQYAQGIPPELRSNIDYVFIFNEPSVANRKRIYDSYGGAVPSFDHFCNILDACTQDHECLVIKTSGNSSKLSDQVFWYKAEEHHNFRVGHPKIWNYHRSNYNQHYEQEAEIDKEKLDQIRRRYAKTRKLKILVSREGEMVGYEQDGNSSKDH